MKEDVKFYKCTDGEIVAVFPKIKFNIEGDLTCYVHNGQHGAITKGYIKGIRLARASEYEDLERELSELVGYHLNNLNKNYKKLTY